MTSPNRPTNIYIIDDEPIDTMIFKLLVNRVDETIDVDTISSAQKALDRLVHISKTHPSDLPDYIFLDLNMPVMNGWNFLHEYERLEISQLKEIPIYILSSSVHHEDVARSKANPSVKQFINKPANLDILKTIFKAA